MKLKIARFLPAAAAFGILIAFKSYVIVIG
jgi:hypothetical protein